MPTVSLLALLFALPFVAACSRDVSTGRRPSTAHEDRTGRAGSGAASVPNDGGRGAGDGRVGVGDNALSVRVEDPAGLELELVTLACAGACADVMAVAKGGNPPYRFAWDDGSSHAARRLCLDDSTVLQVSVTDTAIDTAEFPYAARTATAELRAQVLTCTDAGMGDDPTRDAGATAVCPGGDSVRGDPLNATVTYFRQGAVLPAGRYRVAYLDGCMRFGEPVGWTIHNQLPVSWFLVDDGALISLGVLPGATGLGHDELDDCVAASRAAQPLEVDYAGGKLGVVMVDYPLDDNIGGLDGRDPQWCLIPL